MLILEDGYQLSGRFDLILPLGLTISPDGEKTVTAYAEMRDLGEYLDALDPLDIFTEETKKYIGQSAAKRLEEWGYDGEVVFSTEFVLGSREELNRSLILPSTEPILPEYEYENLTECEPDPFGEGLLCFGTVIDGKIVSMCSENPHGPDDKIIDIGVETASGYEGKGYGASNVAALAYYLLDPGYRVSYIAEDNNLPSVRVAKKVGFTPSTLELRLVCTRIGASGEDEEGPVLPGFMGGGASLGI